ncbi:hypothetical protein [Weissella cibaria]|uniref:hypothetical protein n=1 Tax=Weissella cibaria TaxID=137591 RepID=UPI001E34B227|nr:hypothetical protein [Weissella cibaria]
MSDSKSLQAAADKLAALAGDPNATATDLQNALTAYKARMLRKLHTMPKLRMPRRL